MCCFGWIGQNIDRSAESVTTSQKTFVCGIFRWHLGSDECGEVEDANNILARWNKKQKAFGTRGPVMALATLWTSRRDTPKLEICSAQLRWAIIPQPWGCTIDYYEVLGLLRKWQAPTKRRRDPNSKRTTALAHALHWKEDLHRLYAVGIATWKSKNMPDGLKKEPAPWSCTSGGTTRREEQNTLTQFSSHRKHTINPFARLSVNRNTFPPPAASPFRPKRNSVTHDGPDQAMGAGRQCETPSGAHTSPRYLCSSDKAGKRGLFESPEGSERLGRNLHKPLAKRSQAKRRVRNSTQQVSQTQPGRFESKQRRAN